MNNRAPIALALSSAALLAACDATRPSSETFNWKGPVKEGSWLRLRNTSGDFTVSEGTSDSAMITLNIERSSSYAPSASVKVLSVGDGVLACVLFGDSGDCSESDYKGGSPWTKHFLPFLRGETKVSGNIVLPKGVKLDVESVNGDVSVAAAARDLVIRTVNGDIDVKESFGPVELHTTNGDIEAGVREVNGQVKVGTTNGDVSLTMPSALNAALNMRTVNGELDLGFTGNFTRNTKKSIVATLGLGGSPIEIETTNGDISVKPSGAP
jgi:cytoskeletal protein CcmA (bactofilin family)